MSEKINIGTDVAMYPMPVTLVGADIAGKPNFMAVAWVSRVNFKPTIMAAALHKIHHTPVGIRENGSYSINVPGTDMLELTDYCGLVSGKEMDKSKLFEVFYGETGTAPMIKACPLCMECSLLDVYEMPTNNLYIGEVVATYTEERYLSDGKPDIKKIKPFTLTMPDNEYWSVGACLGKAWSAGKKLNK